MYRPPAFDVADPSELHDLVEASGAAHLVSLTSDGLVGTVVPLLLERQRGPFGTLVGHLARANHHWRDATPGVPSMAIFAGPDAYISPSWYATKRQTGKVVPTWNYVAVHAHGELVVHDDPVWLEDLVRRLTDHHEAARDEPWSVDDAPADFIRSQLRAIVGIELPITRLEGKAKLSQNRPAADVAGTIAGLSTGSPTDRAVAALMTPPS
jgi:transcriptional regulator